MLGSAKTTTGNFTYVIQELLMSQGTLNIEDGGFLAAKLIAELGFLGIIIVLGYMLFIVKILFRSNKIYNKKFITSNEKLELFFNGFIFSFFIEMFLRGYGYFSPGLFIFISALFGLNHIKHKYYSTQKPSDLSNYIKNASMFNNCHKVNTCR